MPTLPYEGNENEMIVMNSYADLNTLVLIFTFKRDFEEDAKKSIIVGSG